MIENPKRVIKGNWNMIRIAVIEDTPADCEKLLGFFDKFSNENGVKFNIKTFSNGRAFLFELRAGLYDLVMMDVDLKDSSNGVDVAVEMRKIDSSVTLIFTTNLAQYAIEGYKVSAVDYIVKPIAYFDFCARMDGVFKRIEENNEKKVSLLCDRKTIVLAPKDIYYVEVMNHVVIYHAKTGVWKTRGSLKTVSEELGSSFSFCNNCFLVNLNYVEVIESFEVVVHGERLQISRQKKKIFLQSLSAFLGE